MTNLKDTKTLVTVGDSITLTKTNVAIVTVIIYVMKNPLCEVI